VTDETVETTETTENPIPGAVEFNDEVKAAIQHIISDYKRDFVVRLVHTMLNPHEGEPRVGFCLLTCDIKDVTSKGIVVSGNLDAKEARKVISKCKDLMDQDETENPPTE